MSTEYYLLCFGIYICIGLIFFELTKNRNPIIDKKTGETKFEALQKSIDKLELLLTPLTGEEKAIKFAKGVMAFGDVTVVMFWPIIILRWIFRATFQR